MARPDLNGQRSVHFCCWKLPGVGDSTNKHKNAQERHAASKQNHSPVIHPNYCKQTSDKAFLLWRFGFIDSTLAFTNGRKCQDEFKFNVLSRPYFWQKETIIAATNTFWFQWQTNHTQISQQSPTWRSFFDVVNTVAMKFQDQEPLKHLDVLLLLTCQVKVWNGN